MRKMARMATGQAMARRVCREIIRCGLAQVLAARYVPESRAVRVGIPTAVGSLDAAIDYECEPKIIERFVVKLRRHAARQQQAA